MNACMYVCISMVLCSDSCLPLLFITLIVISHRFICDCVYFFSFDCEPFVKIWIHTDYVCVLAAFFLLALLFLFVVRFYLHIYRVRLRLSFQLPLSSLNFLGFVIRFLVMHALFNCFVLCLLHRLLPLFFLVFFFVGILYYFPLYMLL